MNTARARWLVVLLVVIAGSMLAGTASAMQLPSGQVTYIPGGDGSFDNGPIWGQGSGDIPDERPDPGDCIPELSPLYGCDCPGGDGCQSDGTPGPKDVIGGELVWRPPFVAGTNDPGDDGQSAEATVDPNCAPGDVCE